MTLAQVIPPVAPPQSAGAGSYGDGHLVNWSDMAGSYTLPDGSQQARGIKLAPKLKIQNP